MPAQTFKTILHANDGSEPAFRALALAINIAKQDAAALHLVCVEEIPPMPEYLEEIREAKGTAARRFHTVVERSSLTPASGAYARPCCACQVRLQTNKRGRPVPGRPHRLSSLNQLCL